MSRIHQSEIASIFASNGRNVRSGKTVQGNLGDIRISTPRDRNGTFEPQFIGEHQRRVPGFDEEILALHVKGMTTRDIQEIVEAEAALEEFARVWDDKYLTISKQWRAKWLHIVTLFDFAFAIRRAIYTTNAIDSVNGVIRTFTRNRKIYPNEQSALKLIYMAINEASRKWTRPIHHWKKAFNHFAVIYEGRMPVLTSNGHAKRPLTQIVLQGPISRRNRMIANVIQLETLTIGEFKCGC